MGDFENEIKELKETIQHLQDKFDQLEYDYDTLQGERDRLAEENDHLDNELEVERDNTRYWQAQHTKDIRIIQGYHMHEGARKVYIKE
jgi:predicted  nucleic acid-binding Zn-ribbon protein